jgi:hypothetical protein
VDAQRRNRTRPVADIALHPPQATRFTAPRPPNAPHGLGFVALVAIYEGMCLPKIVSGSISS